MPESYPPPPIITTAPPPIPESLPSPPSDLDEFLESPKPKGKGKRGGPSIPESVQIANRMANVLPGIIPDAIGARFINGAWERDNCFLGMLSRHFWYDASENVAYPGALAHEVYTWDQEGRSGPNPAQSRSWFGWAPRGLPTTISEGKNLLHKIVTNSKERPIDRFEAWLSLAEFLHISNSFAPIHRDNVMEWAISTLHRLRRPGQWLSFDLVPLDPNAFHPPGSHNAKVPDPEPSLALDIDSWARLLVHHGRPGIRNTYHGIIMDRAYRVW
jgi:hypothetical protein